MAGATATGAGAGAATGAGAGAATGAGAGACVVGAVGIGLTASATAACVSWGSASIKDWITLVLAMTACAIIWIVWSFMIEKSFTFYRGLDDDAVLDECVDEFT